MSGRSGLLALAALLLAGAPHPARADSDEDKAAITERLQRWAAAFNARDVPGTCDLFAPTLISTVPGALEGDRDAVCTRLAAVLAKPELQLQYSPDIREIEVSGDLAVVRLFWTLTAQKDAERKTSREAGLDIFERQPDGRWSIVRFMSFTIGSDLTR